MEYLLPDLFDISLFCLDLNEYCDICKHFNIPLKFNNYYNQKYPDYDWKQPETFDDEFIDAYRNNNLELVMFLHEIYPDIDLEYAYRYIIQQGYLQLLRYFYEKTELILNYCPHPLQLATHNNQLNICKYLIENKIDDDIRNALFAAVNCKNLDIVKYLCENYLCEHPEFKNYLRYYTIDDALAIAKYIPHPNDEIINYLKSKQKGMFSKLISYFI